MTSDKIREMQAAYDKVGHIGFEGERLAFCEGAVRGGIGREDALNEIENAWNALGELLSEVADLSQDRARMNCSLRNIQQIVTDAMQGTARSEVPADWWEHVEG